MPLPLGHAFIGAATYELCLDNNSIFRQWQVALFTMVLANLPDLDIFIGLVFRGNGNAFHRGPTHSLLFVLIMGYFASNLWKY